MLFFVLKKNCLKIPRVFLQPFSRKQIKDKCSSKENKDLKKASEKKVFHKGDYNVLMFPLSTKLLAGTAASSLKKKLFSEK